MKKTKEQKGITLIALIITIVVLLILAVVAINSIQNDGILSHAGNTANTYNQAVKNEQDTLQNYLDYLDKNNGGSTNNPESGSEDDSGSGSTEGTTYTAYTIGDEVTVIDNDGISHAFYVMADSSETEEMVLLLAKENIDTTNLVQSASAATVAFSTESYWGEGTSPYNIEEPETIPESHTAAKAAYDYGVKVGGTGRLMTYTEAITLRGTYSAMIYGTETANTNGYLNYWLGSAYSADNVCFVYGGSVLGNGDYGNGGHYGVRPVVEISKSKLS